MAYEDNPRQSALPHKLTLEERTKLSVSGVEEVESFDDDRIELRTVRGRLMITGEGLHIGKLSLETGELCRLIDEAAARRGDAAALEENVRKLRAIEHRSMETAARLLGKEVQEIC